MKQKTTKPAKTVQDLSKKRQFDDAFDSQHMFLEDESDIAYFQHEYETAPEHLYFN